MMHEALNVARASGEWIGAFPERNAVGERQPNGRAEVAVQQVKGQTRALLAELERHLDMQSSADHPVLA